MNRLRKQVPVILTVHDSNFLHGKASHSLQRLRWRSAMKAADHFVVHVPSAVEQLRAAGVSGEKIHLIPHPPFKKPSDERIAAAKKKYPLEALGFSEDKVNFLLFGRLAPPGGYRPLFSDGRSLARAP